MEPLVREEVQLDKLRLVLYGRTMKRPVKQEFSARGSLCPICKRNFRDPDSCPHSVGQAEDRIEADYLRAVVRYEMAKEVKRQAKKETN